MMDPASELFRPLDQILTNCLFVFLHQLPSRKMIVTPPNRVLSVSSLACLHGLHKCNAIEVSYLSLYPITGLSLWNISTPIQLYIINIIIAGSCFITNLNAKSFYNRLPPDKSGSAETIVTFLTYYHSPMDLDFFHQ